MLLWCYISLFDSRAQRAKMLSTFSSFFDMSKKFSLSKTQNRVLKNYAEILVFVQFLDSSLLGTMIKGPKAEK